MQIRCFKWLNVIRIDTVDPLVTVVFVNHLGYSHTTYIIKIMDRVGVHSKFSRVIDNKLELIS